MVKKHLKRIAAPKEWRIRRKLSVFILRPYPGRHTMRTSIPIGVVFREILHLARTMKEVRAIMQNKKILINKKRVTDPKVAIGFMDVLEIDDLKKAYRVLFNKNGELVFHEIDKDDTSERLLKVTGATLTKKGVQVHFSDGTNLLGIKEKVSAGDTIIYDMVKNEVSGHIKLDNGVIAFVSSGKMIGNIVKVLRIEGNNAVIELYNNNKEKSSLVTLKKNLFVIGKDKPVIKL